MKIKLGWMDYASTAPVALTGCGRFCRVRGSAILPAMSISNRTIQGAIDLGLNVTAYCHAKACGHKGKVDLFKFRDKLGADHGALHDDLAPYLYCSRCGGKEIGLIYSPADNDRLTAKNEYQRVREGR